MGKNVHITKKDIGWSVKTAGSEKAVKITATQKEAIEKGKSIAQNQNSELIIHGTNGRIREKNSYGKASQSIRG